MENGNCNDISERINALNSTLESLAHSVSQISDDCTNSGRDNNGNNNNNSQNDNSRNNNTSNSTSFGGEA